MKKVVLMLALVTSGLSVCAQEEGDSGKSRSKDSRNKFHFGLKAGINSSNVYDESGDDFAASSKLGFAGGVFIQVPLGKYLGVHPEVLISQKGFRATGNYMGTQYDMRRTTTYLDVPVLGAFKPATFLTFVGGPQYSYLLKQTDLFSNSSSLAIQEEDFENTDVRKNILSAVVGLDINIGNIVLGGRYNFDLQRNHSDGSASTPRYKNVWLQGTVGYRF
jgi:hypothetical protein